MPSGAMGDSFWKLGRAFQGRRRAKSQSVQPWLQPCREYNPQNTIVWIPTEYQDEKDEKNILKQQD